ncbi:ureidoglycolate lyase [Caldalkalibacillus thermarum]|uniref:fumarylacetoacetate hydrolase family protein n=1 Tax=Caldalkalibacillus thermarum TaxID=296745 RepID=UPI00166AEB32|nr:fumarylacetoacetate hydrolase family protein [Caldalkalibacillus thermarum]GGK22257.1 ureidoglycolate lyase [Caldalkalibacillus thermarum]
MKLVTFSFNGLTRVGALVDQQVVDLNAAYTALLADKGEASPVLVAQAMVPSEMLTFLERGEAALAEAKKAMDYALGSPGSGLNGARLIYAVDEVKLKAPIPRPGKLVCVGLNYVDHCEETGMDIPKSPVIFSKYANAVVGPDDAILLPPNSDQVDYEAELAFVIGKKAKQVSESEAMAYIAGYTIINDVSARDIQLGDGQWVRGKSPDSFAPMGPVLVTRDEIEDPHQLDIKLHLNGETMQDSNTKNLIFNIPYILSYLSQSMTFEPGDVIATGTPPGVGMSREPQVFLKDGDEVIVEVEKIGKLRNVVKGNQ